MRAHSDSVSVSVWAAVFAVLASALFLVSNLWFRERVTSPILGLGDTARHIADGSYGTLAERLRDDEIELTLLLPITADASEAAKYPEPITMTIDGEVVLPC